MRGTIRSGLTLVELVITITLAVIISISVGLLLSQHLTSALRARDCTIAMNLARYEMERLDSLNDFCHVDLTVNSPGGLSIPSYQSYPYTLTRTVWCQANDCSSNCTTTPTNAKNGMKRIEILVTKNASTDRLAFLVTYRTKFVLFGS